MLELNPKAHHQLTQNILTLKTSSVEAIHTDSIEYLKSNGTPFDIVFIDPPFRKGILDETLQLLESNQWLADNAMIYIETEKELTLEGIPENWSLFREKTAGQVCYRLFERSPK